MSYSTMREVEAASHRQLAHWYRFLGSAGRDAVGKPDFEDLLQAQLKIQERLLERFDEIGGWSPVLSKQMGWDK